MNKSFNEVDKTKTCYECVNYALCFLRINIDNDITNARLLLDFDSNNPSVVGWQFVFVALANICLKYKNIND